ncbi:hypothetical protein [Cardiobacterium valvarum]|uniref:Uncharacterized protein n=1 Tax=Cardiobacterium valvarum TaxID=194702 RepID=A0A381E858_9GAMM|nr:hypothetical protein [Cardiobacterium valvarum]SUX22962.1 Uncharacterised protein [Cardiobacterium valvarum]
MWDKTQLPPTPAELALLRQQLTALSAQQQATRLAHGWHVQVPDEKQPMQRDRKSLLGLFVEGFAEGWKEAKVMSTLKQRKLEELNDNQRNHSFLNHSYDDYDSYDRYDNYLKISD